MRQNCLTGQHRKMWLNAIKSKRNPLPLKSLSNPMLTTTDRWLRVVLYSCKVYEWNKTSKNKWTRNAMLELTSSLCNRVCILVTLQRTVPLGMFKNWLNVWGVFRCFCNCACILFVPMRIDLLTARTFARPIKSKNSCELFTKLVKHCLLYSMNCINWKLMWVC